MIKLQIVGTVVSEILVGYTITLRFGKPQVDYELQIECAMSLSDSEGVAEVKPEGYALIESRLESLVGATVIAALADEEDGLTMSFDNNVTVSVPVDPDFEAWGIAGPGGYRVISNPGGGFSLWSEKH